MLQTLHGMRRGPLPSAAPRLSWFAMDAHPPMDLAADLDRAVIEVRGPDAAHFLQGLISNDIARARDGALAYAFLLTPQGKYLFDFFIAKISDGFQLDVAAADGAALAARLTQYKLRAKVQIAPRPDLAVYGLPTAKPVAHSLPDPRVADLGGRITVDNATAASQLAGLKVADIGPYESRRIALGVPDHHDFVKEQSFLLECNGEELHGVDFRKGCYVGQELTARMKHRGTARRRILRVLGAGVARGDTIQDGDREIGAVLSASDGQALGLVRLDRWRDAGARPLTAGGRPATLSLPAYHMFLPPEEALP